MRAQALFLGPWRLLRKNCHGWSYITSPALWRQNLVMQWFQPWPKGLSPLVREHQQRVRGCHLQRQDAVLWPQSLRGNHLRNHEDMINVYQQFSEYTLNIVLSMIRGVKVVFLVFFMNVDSGHCKLILFFDALIFFTVNSSECSGACEAGWSLWSMFCYRFHLVPGQEVCHAGRMDGLDDWMLPLITASGYAAHDLFFHLSCWGSLCVTQVSWGSQELDRSWRNLSCRRLSLGAFAECTCKSEKRMIRVAVRWLLEII